MLNLTLNNFYHIIGESGGASHSGEPVLLVRFVDTEAVLTNTPIPALDLLFCPIGRDLLCVGFVVIGGFDDSLSILSAPI